MFMERGLETQLALWKQLEHEAGFSPGGSTIITDEPAPPPSPEGDDVGGMPVAWKSPPEDYVKSTDVFVACVWNLP